jgi:DNA-binding transcriptional ArsR family regulator
MTHPFVASTIHDIMNRAMTLQRFDNGARRPDPRVPVLKELAEPLRLRVVDRLSNGGPATVTEMAREFGVPLPQLSNHLRRLRTAGLVRVRREGRHGIYELTDPGLEALMPLLDRLAGRIIGPQPPSSSDFARSRTCYDHLGGKLGVGIYAALLERDAIRSLPDGTVELGPAAGRAFSALGVDPTGVHQGRRRFAFECLDSTELRPHLAGALGDAVADGLAARGWIDRDAAARTVHVTDRGARGLKRTLGVAAPK